MSPTKIAIAVVERAGEYLIGLRPAGAPLAGLWEFPGGKVQPGESCAAAAVRECYEETGIAIEVGSSETTVEHRYAFGDVELHFFFCTAPAGAQSIDPRFRWVPASRLGEHEFPAANASIVRRLIDGAGR